MTMAIIRVTKQVILWAILIFLSMRFSGLGRAAAPAGRRYWAGLGCWGHWPWPFGMCPSIRPAEHGFWPVLRCCHTKERKNFRRCGEPGKPAFSGQGCLWAQWRNAFINGKSLLVHDLKKRMGKPCLHRRSTSPRWTLAGVRHGGAWQHPEGKCTPQAAVT